MLSLVNGLGTEVTEESAPSPAGELLTLAVDAALPLDHLHGTGVTVRNDTAMPAHQPVETDRPAPARICEWESAAAPRLTGGSTGSMDTAARPGVAAAITTLTRAPVSAAVTGISARPGTGAGRAPGIRRRGLDRFT
ncbi:hypothetical protein ACIA8K_15050 [Catenuloplanes sp. NPDC051500]|uniref:hypothetical protein n=1 Tax=Catenuloplanes sp. NPDC051500 TaxID=3363959 RepID=UPI003789C224